MHYALVKAVIDGVGVLVVIALGIVTVNLLDL